MLLETRQRPHLREPIERLLDRLVPALREGGTSKLTELVHTAVGNRLDASALRLLETRGDLVVHAHAEQAANEQVRGFENDGPHLRVPLKSFRLVVPKRLAGHARLLAGGAGVALTFAQGAGPSVEKLLLSAEVESVEVTRERIRVDLRGLSSLARILGPFT